MKHATFVFLHWFKNDGILYFPGTFSPPRIHIFVHIYFTTGAALDEVIGVAQIIFVDKKW